MSLPVDLLSEALPTFLEKYLQLICTSSSSSTPGREKSTSMLLPKVVTYTHSMFIEI